MRIRTSTTLIVLSFILLLPTTAFAQVRSIVFPVDGIASFRDDYLDPRGGGTRLHHATDLFADKHTPVVAAVDGVIVYMPIPEPSWGYMITLQGNDGYQYRYIHLNNDSIGTDDGAGGPSLAYAPGLKRGSSVQAGQVIGWLGDSGNAEHTAPHLHFEIHAPGGNRINPYQSLIVAAPPESFLIAPPVSHTHDQLDEAAEAVIDAASRFYFTIELREGMQGEAVRELQQRLKEEGFFTNPYTTKYFGPLTKAALIEFQKANNIAPNGVFGFESRAILNNETPKGVSLRLEKELFEGDSGETVYQVEFKLQELGFFDEEPDEDFDWKTREALRIFQREKNLPTTGHLSFDSWNELNSSFSSLPKPVVPSPQPATQTSNVDSEYVFTLSMKIGSRGNEVVKLQDVLRNFGHFPDNIISTGYYGPVTAEAVRKFQDAHNIETVGVVGPITRAALNNL